MAALVSILIPAYNAGPWIGAAIQSALDQTWERTEIIVVDDGSKDNTLAQASRFATAKVKVVSQRNAGAAAARNHALSLAQGDFLQWLDADDLLGKNKVESQVRAAERIADDRVLFSSGWSRFYHRPERGLIAASALWTDLDPAEWLTLKLEQNLYMIVESWLVSRALAEAAGRWNEALNADDDGDYFCRVIQAAKAVKFVPGGLSHYRTSSGNSLSSVNFSRRKAESQFTSICTHIASLQALRNDERTRSACIAFLQRWLIHFYPEHGAICRQAMELAEQLGGKLRVPPLPVKYEMLRRCFGWRLAKRAMFELPKVRSGVERRWDGLLQNLSRKPAEW